MTILGSRNDYFITPLARNAHRDTNEMCRALIHGTRGFIYTAGTELLSTLRLVEEEPWDIEDMVLLGTRHRRCPYHAAQTVYQYAHLILCSYNYILDRVCRSARGIDLSNSLIVFDEAHNFEELSRNFSSCRVNIGQITTTANMAQH